MAHPKFAPKSTPSRKPIRKHHYLPHPWTRPTSDAKRHPDPIRRFSTMHWTDRRTDAPTDRSSTWKFDDYSPLRLWRERRGLNNTVCYSRPIPTFCVPQKSDDVGRQISHDKIDRYLPFVWHELKST